MRVTVAIFAAVMALVLGRFVWDDVISGEDIPRGVSVEGVAIGNTDRATAAERLLTGVTADRNVDLTLNGAFVAGTLAEWGVVIDTEATLDRATATRGGWPSRVLRWTAAVVRDRTVEPVWRLDTETLTDRFGPEALDVAVITAAIELGPDGEFVSTEPPAIPIVDIDALAALLLDAVVDETVSVIVVPTQGFHPVEDARQLADAANELTAAPITVVLAGQFEEHEVASSTLRAWLDVDGVEQAEELTFDQERVVRTLRSFYPDPSTAGGDHGVQFVIGFDGLVYVVGALEGAECCASDTAAQLMASLWDGVGQPFIVFPDEPPDAEGLAWAESLGITEVVGEFTTFYKPDQTRNINIARIAELTRGAIIEPGETFSVNGFVGPRTTEKGFVAAGVISNGVFDSSVGGGISQYATTLFNAAFFAGLDFGHYQSHSIYISRYPYGREATVSYPAPDLQIVNNTPYGVMLWPTTNADSITVRLYSTPWVSGAQTGQTERTEGSSCTRVTTERTRTWLDDGHTEVDSVTARYRAEGINCDGSSTRPTTTAVPTTIPTTVP